MNRKKLHSKVFQGFNMDIGIDRDSEHQKVWSDKVQQTKHVQQMKQIDKIFQGIVKERIFGTIITEKSRLSSEEYSILDRINKTMTNSFRNTNSRFSSFNKTANNSPVRRLSPYSIQTPAHNLKEKRKNTLQPLNTTNYNKKFQGRNKAFTIDVSTIYDQIQRFASKDSSKGQKSPNLSINLNSAKFPSSQEKYSALFRSKTDVKSIPSKYKKPSRKQSVTILKLMNLDQLDSFQDHFKNLSLTPDIFLYDIKLTRETILLKTKDKVSPRLMEYFLYFFGFPAVMTFRQYKKCIQKAFNSAVSLIYFFLFRVLDESGNGFLTISDLFRFLQKSPESEYLQTELFKIRTQINQTSKHLMTKSEQMRQVKATLQQILVINHKLKADEVSELLKQSVKQEINKGGQVKLTCYSQSILSLEHDVHVRLKQYELQNQKNQSEAINANKSSNQKVNEVMSQDGIRINDFGIIFSGHRPKIFCNLVNILTGLQNQDFQ